MKGTQWKIEVSKGPEWKSERHRMGETAYLSSDEEGKERYIRSSSIFRL